MNDAIFCQLNMRRKRTCQRSRRRPLVACALSRSENSFITAVREHHRTPVAASIYSFSLLSQRRTSVGRGSCCSLVTGLSLYPHTRVCYSPRVEGLAPFCLLLVSAGSHTYQAILILLPKLTNAPTKVHKGCLAHWDSECNIMLYTFAMYNASFLLLVALLIIPLLQLSLNYTHISVSNICTYHFYWGFASNGKICGTSGKIISLK